MARKTLHSRVWPLVKREHGVITRQQLLALGVSSSAIEERLANGRLHPARRGVYAVGRPQLTREGHWMAAILSCGPEAVASHETAAAVWNIRAERRAAIEVSVPIECFDEDRESRSTDGQVLPAGT